MNMGESVLFTMYRHGQGRHTKSVTCCRSPRWERPGPQTNLALPQLHRFKGRQLSSGSSFTGTLRSAYNTNPCVARGTGAAWVLSLGPSQALGGGPCGWRLQRACTGGSGAGAGVRAPTLRVVSKVAALSAHAPHLSGLTIL
ncbi:hypothetical protein HJG60_011627 [Phyllostomus discolor]|uniref:Uncharacterized protein n=1 Tax=Phyllostomus discolor TaxID=89673 RepID=A0A833ZNY3_9CHIR|nr:hypothetical protein HJG60_011627 [Phyllostomus discolor]